MARARRNRDDPSRHLTLLDMGVDASPLRRSLDLGSVPRLLRLAPGGAPGAGAEPFPTRGELPRAFKPITFLDFVENDVPCISHACVAVGALKDGEMYTTWYGKNATAKEQFWSATKQVNALAVIADLNSRMPTTPIATLKMQQRGAPGTAVELPRLIKAIVTYKDPKYSSNGTAKTFGALVGNWKRGEFIKRNTGSRDVEFGGGYGERAIFDTPEIANAAGTVVMEPPTPTPSGNNYVSAYDLTRLAAMFTWHPHLRTDQRIPGVQLHSLDTLNGALAHDSARYMDDAIVGLDLKDRLQNVAICSKLGFGPRSSTGRWNLAYSGAISFDDTAYPDPVRRCMAFTLRADVRDGVSIDSRMAQATHMLLGKLVNNEL